MATKTAVPSRLKRISKLTPKPTRSEPKVTMSNALTRAGHGLTLSEKRVVALAASKIDSRANMPPDMVLRTRLTAAEYAQCFQVDPTTAYEQLKAAEDHLYARSISFFTPAHRRGGTTLVPAKTRWISDVQYHKTEGWIELAWAPKIVPHLVGLKRQFTTYQLQQASALRSTYSWRLLELLARFKSTGWAEYAIEDFCASMDATAKQRENFARIRTKIIEPAVRELREKDGWLIEWRPIKRGRKVASVHFEFKRDPQQRLALDAD